MDTLIIIMAVCVFFLLLIWAAYRRDVVRRDTEHFKTLTDLHCEILDESHKREFIKEQQRKACQLSCTMLRAENKNLKSQLANRKGQITKLRKKLEGGAE